MPASRVMDWPWHTLVSFPKETLIAGARSTVASNTALQFSGVVTVTEYVPDEEATMLCPVAPVLQTKLLPPLPAFSEGGELMHAVASWSASTGIGLNWTSIASEAVQLFAFVTVTLKVPLFGTRMDCDWAAVLHT